MNDRFKYRFWDADFNAMIYGVSISAHYKSVLVGISVDDIEKQLPNVDEFELEEKGWDVIDDWTSCDSTGEYVMQCTGLQDSKGQDIYEGDVVRVSDCPSYFFSQDDFEDYVVRFIPDIVPGFDLYKETMKDKGRRFEPMSDEWCAFTLPAKFEVIGNIYQTPEKVK